MPIVDPPWPEVHAHNRDLLDICIRLLADRSPRYRSSQWHALPIDHPERFAAIQRAADAWHDYWQPDAVTVRRRADADRIDRAVLNRVRAVSHDISAAANWARIGQGPTWHQLQRLREPWIYDSAWRCRHHRPNGRCLACATGNDHPLQTPTAA